MAIGGGFLPPSGAVLNELVAVTRRAFIPKVIVQLYQATPTLSAFLAAAEPIMGGVSPVTVPLQNTAMTTTSTTDYSGSFAAPQLQTGLTNAEFTLAAMVTPIPYYVMEGLGQIEAAVIPLIEARMNDAGNSMAKYLNDKLWAAQSANSANDIFSIADVISTTNPTQANYGNISRSTNTFWQANVKTATTLGGTAITRANMVTAITSATKASGGEMPSFGVLGPGTWAALAQDYIGSERYNITPERAFSDVEDGARAAFTAIMVSGVPFYMDLAAGENQVVLFNSSYIGFKLHADAAFALAGPESLLPNMQLAYLLVLVTLLQLICTKPKAQSLFTGYSGALTGV